MINNILKIKTFVIVILLARNCFAQNVYIYSQNNFILPQEYKKNCKIDFSDVNILKVKNDTLLFEPINNRPRLTISCHNDVILDTILKVFKIPLPNIKIKLDEYIVYKNRQTDTLILDLDTIQQLKQLKLQFFPNSEYRDNCPSDAVFSPKEWDITLNFENGNKKSIELDSIDYITLNDEDIQLKDVKKIMITFTDYKRKKFNGNWIDYKFPTVAININIILENNKMLFVVN